MRTIILALAFLTIGCAPATAPVGFTSTKGFDPEPADVQTALEACVDGHPVCVEAVYCDADSDDERCADEPVNACLVRPVPKDEECFDGTIGRCDGQGRCR